MLKDLWKKRSKGFTLLELIVVIAIIAVLVLIAMPKVGRHIDKAKLVRIQHDVKVMEGNIGEKLIHDNKSLNNWDNNTKDLHLLSMANMLFEHEGHATSVENVAVGFEGIDLFADSDATKGYKAIPVAVKKEIKTRLDGTFYTNPNGKVYYEPNKPLKVDKKPQAVGCEKALPDYTFEHTTGTIVKYNGSAQHLVIPSSFLVDGQCYPVLIIGRGAFMNGGFKTVVIPEGVKVIEEDAFKGNDLEKIEIPSSVTDIGNDAFADNNFTKKEDVVINNKPGNVNISNGGGFGGNADYVGSDIVITTGSGGNGNYTGGGVVSNGDISFDTGTGTIVSGGNSNTIVVIPEKIIVDGVEHPVKEVAKGAYQGKGLITVVMPSGLKRIEDYAFAGNQLIAVNIPDSVEHIGNYAFAFNEMEKVGNIKGPKTIDTIRSINIKGNEYINKLDKLGNIKEAVTGVRLLKHVFVTSNMTHTIIDGDDDGNGDTDVPNVPVDKRVHMTEEEIDTFFANNNYYIPISSPEDLEAIKSNSLHNFGRDTKWEKEINGGLNKKYIQVSNIDLSAIVNFTPIGNKATKFKGTYNGGNFVIKNLRIYKPDEEYIGLFGFIEESTIENVGLVNVSVTGKNFVGSLVGLSNKNFDNNTNSKVVFSYSTGCVNGENSVGGLVGRSYFGIVQKNYSTTDVVGGSRVGGLVGYNDAGSVVSSYSEGSVVGGIQVGGLVGDSISNNIKDSYSTSSVVGRKYVGGLIGYNYATSVSNCYSKGSVTSTLDSLDYVGGLVGHNWNSSSFSRSYWDVSTSGRSKSSSGISSSTVSMQNKATYKYWDFNRIWQINPGEYPTLQWQNK